ncbi:MAG: hypothetical protein NZ517_03605 [Candidatus Nitrosocaldus sp.]|nr:hypothetical protein [Candidatus Nitrosocaldus sp.]
MGFSIVIASAIMFIALLTSLAVMLTVASNMHKANDAMVKGTMLRKDISDTSIDIDDLTINSSDRRHISFLLSNDGKSKLFNYTHFDLIVTYYYKDAMNNDILGVERLSYGNALQQGYWRLSIQDDIIDPKVLNPKEGALVEAMLSNPITSTTGRSIVVTVATDNGVTATLASTT